MGFKLCNGERRGRTHGSLFNNYYPSRGQSNPSLVGIYPPSLETITNPLGQSCWPANRHPSPYHLRPEINLRKGITTKHPTVGESDHIANFWDADPASSPLLFLFFCFSRPGS
ncbi:hypothetical protein L249_2497, partial [Ophiocordyceps polyrhachis-furcata BCC 54312]